MNLAYTRNSLLTPGTTYEFKVVAFNDVGSSLESGAVAIKAA